MRKMPSEAGKTEYFTGQFLKGSTMLPQKANAAPLHGIRHMILNTWSLALGISEISFCCNE